eukprot:1341938-Amorphochlora_amoeboformis.AAC.1
MSRKRHTKEDYLFPGSESREQWRGSREEMVYLVRDIFRVKTGRDEGPALSLRIASSSLGSL